MNGSTLIGSPRHKSRRSLERLVVLTQSSVLPTQLGELSPLLGRQTGPVTGIGLGLDHPRPHCRLTEVEVLATWPMLRSPRLQRSTISALNSGVNDRRGRGFFRSMVSILDILSGALPLMVDVRQTGGSPLLQLSYSQ